MNACFIHFHHVHSLLVGVGYVHHMLNHANVFFVFLALRLIQRPRQPPSSPDGSDGIVSKAFDTFDHDARVWKSDNFLE